jgi:hypothetical protein
VNDTPKGRLDLEAYCGRTFEGVAIHVAQRILAMAAAIWHDNKTGAQPEPDFILRGQAAAELRPG